METGAPGDSHAPLRDALYAEATQILHRSASELRRLQVRLGDSQAPEARHSDARLESAAREVEQIQLSLERQDTTERASPDRAAEVDGQLDAGLTRTIARHVLEAQEAERTRVAEELHDGPAQALANAVFQVEVIERSLMRDPQQGRAELQALRMLLDREMERLRGIIHQLRPVLGADADLEQALSELAERIQAETGTRVEIGFHAPPRLLDERQRSAVLRIAQEALRNAQKHADARLVRLTTRVEPSDGASVDVAWVLEVRDDGRGFVVDDAQPAAGRRHFGLRFMQERARLINARCEIDSQPAHGTIVRLKLDTGEESQAWP